MGKAVKEKVDQVTGEILEYVRSLRPRSFLTARGQERPDPRPMEPPIGFKKQPSLHERIREMVRSEQLRLAAEKAGAETFEEADDFDIEDDLDIRSPYEIPWEPNFDPPPAPEAGQPRPEAAAERPQGVEAPEVPQSSNPPPG